MTQKCEISERFRLEITFLEHRKFEASVLNWALNWVGSSVWFWPGYARSCCRKYLCDLYIASCNHKVFGRIRLLYNSTLISWLGSSIKKVVESALNKIEYFEFIIRTSSGRKWSKNVSERSFQTRSRIATSLTLLKNRSHAYHSHTSKYHRFSTSSISYFWKKNGMHILKFSGMWAYSACRPTLPFTSINLSSHDNFFLLFQRFCWTFFWTSAFFAFLRDATLQFSCVFWPFLAFHLFFFTMHSFACSSFKYLVTRCL